MIRDRKEYHKQWYQKNKERILAHQNEYRREHPEVGESYRKRTRQRNIERLANYRAEHYHKYYEGKVCEECGGTEMLCYHHIDPSTKLFDIGRDFCRSEEEIQAEIKKCVIICKYCHTKIHAFLRKFNPS